MQIILRLHTRSKRTKPRCNILCYKNGSLFSGNIEDITCGCRNNGNLTVCFRQDNRRNSKSCTIYVFEGVQFRNTSLCCDSHIHLRLVLRICISRPHRCAVMEQLHQRSQRITSVCSSLSGLCGLFFQVFNGQCRNENRVLLEIQWCFRVMDEHRHIQHKGLRRFLGCQVGHSF